MGNERNKPYLKIDPERQPVTAEGDNAKILDELAREFEQRFPGLINLGTKIIFKDQQAIDELADLVENEIPSSIQVDTDKPADNPQ